DPGGDFGTFRLRAERWQRELEREPAAERGGNLQEIAAGRAKRRRHGRFILPAQLRPRKRRASAQRLASPPGRARKERNRLSSLSCRRRTASTLNTSRAQATTIVFAHT